MENIILKPLASFDEFEKRRRDTDFFLLYASRPGCGVCDALKPKVARVVQEIPGLQGFYADLEKIPLLAGQLSLFTVPVMAVFVQGRESFREARNLSVPLLQEKLERLAELMAD